MLIVSSKDTSEMVKPYGGMFKVPIFEIKAEDDEIQSTEKKAKKSTKKKVLSIKEQGQKGIKTYFSPLPKI